MHADATRVALVTGAARGIGAATVDRLVAAGCSVVALDACIGDSSERPPGVGYALADQADLGALVARHGDRVVPFVGDVRDLGSLREAAALAVSAFGRLDVAVAAAAVMVGGSPLWETPSEHLTTLMDVDVVGVWNTAAATVPLMLSGPDPSGCRFVAIASAAGDRGPHNLAGYSAAKHALSGSCGASRRTSSELG